mmetsp:Transcript_118886/g.296579  ORF Transcript_118886/g.296579 Transcript_118886/m.296579 type:complete len:339 (-) Transcript_118886:78-1094(-)
MDDARKLLDSLMGQTRDANTEDAKKMKGKNFTLDNVCKFHLLGFCPQHELQNSKLTTKRNLGECRKVHSDAMVAEYKAHPDKEKYRTEYEKEFLPFLEAQVREADAWVARERANAQKATANASEKTTISTMPDSVKEQVEALTQDMNKMMASAEELAEKGDIEGSQFKVTLAEEIKSKVKDIEDKHPSYTVTLREEWVCEVCGTRTEAVTEQNTTRFQAHFTGKVHLGYAKIREWVKDIRKRQRDADVSRSKKEEAEREERRRRRASRSRDRPSKEADGEKKGDADRKADTDRRRRRSRSREDRTARDDDRRRDRDRGERRRSRSRGGDREDRGRRRG